MLNKKMVSMKKKASEEGKYVMKEGEAKHWGEQMALLEALHC